MFCEGKTFYYCKSTDGTHKCFSPPCLARMSCKKFNCPNLIRRELLTDECPKKLDMIMGGGYCSKCEIAGRINFGDTVRL